MEKNYTCKRCNCSGAKSLIPYKIIKDTDGESVKFVMQLCERCYKELFEPQKKGETNGTETTENK